MKLLLGLSDFPAPQIHTEYSQELMHQGECAICFMARLEGELPSRACDNEKCGLMYHVACLCEVQFYPYAKYLLVSHNTTVPCFRGTYKQNVKGPSSLHLKTKTDPVSETLCFLVI
jgi:hypothetical protein